MRATDYTSSRSRLDGVSPAQHDSDRIKTGPAPTGRSRPFFLRALRALCGKTRYPQQQHVFASRAGTTSWLITSSSVSRATISSAWPSRTSTIAGRVKRL